MQSLRKPLKFVPANNSVFNTYYTYLMLVIRIKQFPLTVEQTKTVTSNYMGANLHF